MTQRVLLVVDDEENILRALVRLLRRDGYLLLTANGGAQGLELLAQHPVGVILSDQRMPGMTGSEFLERAKALRPDAVRIMLSGYTDLQSVTDAINRGAIYRFLTKPWDDELLRENIRVAFEQYERHAENKRLLVELHAANARLTESNAELQQRMADQVRLLEQQQHLLDHSHALLERLPVGVLVVGEDGVIAQANATAAMLLGMELAVLLGDSAQQMLPPLLHEACLATAPVSSPWRLVAQNHTMMVYVTQADELLDGGRLLVLAPNAADAC